MYIQISNKKAVSEMIGYILLITFAIVIAGVVFQWLKTYVPKEGIACPDGVSIYVSDYNFSASLKELSLTLKNNGQFSIGGIFIYYSTNASQEIASNDLSRNINLTNKYLAPGVALGAPGKNDFEPDKEISVIFNTGNLTDKIIYAVEITPIRWQEEKNKIKIVSCASAKTKKTLNLDIS